MVKSLLHIDIQNNWGPELYARFYHIFSSFMIFDPILTLYSYNPNSMNSLKSVNNLCKLGMALS